MKNILLLFFASLCFIVKSQSFITIDNSNASHYTSYNVGQTFIDTSFKFFNVLATYDPILLTRGVHFKNRVANIMTKNMIDADDFKSSPTIGVHGNGTIFKFNGIWESDGGQAKPSIILRDSAKFILGATAQVDIINSAYFTRQFWIWGDSTGIFEIEPEFIADLTMFGTQDKGCGSLRFSKIIFVSHQSQSLPFGYRPNINTSIADVNSHLVFENAGGSIWRILSNDQEYRGGLWLDADMSVDAQKNITLSGIRTETNAPIGGYYVNWGGIMMKQVNKRPSTLTKTGPGKLLITGDGGYDTNSKINIVEGEIEFRADPFTYIDNKYLIEYKAKNVISANLDIDIWNMGTLSINISNSGLARIDSLSMTSSATLYISLNDTLRMRKAKFAGNLHIVIPNGLALTTGDTFCILPSWQGTNGSFSTIDLPNFGDAISWNTSKLYSDGKIFISSGSVITNNITSDKPMSIWNENPMNDHCIIYFKKFITGKANITSLDGRTLVKQPFSGTQCNINSSELKSGLYILQMYSSDDVLIYKTKIVK